MTEPTASMTDLEVKFSDGISSSPFHCRPFSEGLMGSARRVRECQLKSINEGSKYV